jgi:hypothetical protein
MDFHNALVTYRALSLCLWLGLACVPVCEARAAQSKPGFRLHCRQEYPVGSGSRPQGVLLRDLDGDGRPELIGLTYAAGSLQISGGYAPAARALPEVRTLEVGDWAVGPAWLGASDLVAFAPRKPSELVVVDARAVWAGKNAEAVRWRTPLARRARFLATGDLGHDGKFEVLVATVDDDLLVFDAQDSSRKQHLCDAHASCLSVLPGGDGFLVGFQGTRRLVWYTPTKSNEFGFEPGPAVQLSGLPRKILVADLDHDGDDEIAVALGDRSLWVYGLGRAGGVRAALEAKALELDVADVPIDLAAADLDGKPGNELACLSLAGQELQTFVWREGSLRSLARAYAGQAPSAFACGDLDGDGHGDFAFANGSASRWGVVFGLAGGGLDVAPELPCGRGPSVLASGDLDGDGHKEVLVLNATEGTLSVLPGAASGFGPPQTLIRAASADALRLADADGDGKLDALWLAEIDKAWSLKIAFGDGRGAVWERAVVPPLPVAKAPGGLVVADLDGDGAPEIVVSDPDQDLLRLFTRRTAAGQDPRFEEAARLALPGGPGPLVAIDARRIAVGLAGRAERKGFAIAEVAKSADGTWILESHTFVPLTQDVRDVCTADFDGDGRADLALLLAEHNGSGAGVAVPVLGLAEGGWKVLEGLTTGLFPYQIAAADLDGDGRAEILVSSQNSHQLNCWFAGTAGGFARGPDLGVGTGPLGLVLQDLDGDGVPEILCANHFSDSVSVLRVR